MTEKLDDGTEWGSLSIRLPPELRGYGPDLQRFFDAMVFKLRRNAHKGKWETVPVPLALERLDDEMGELRAAIVNGSTIEVTMEAADVANMALIIANISLEAREEGVTEWRATKRTEGWAIGRMVNGLTQLWTDSTVGTRYYNRLEDAEQWADHVNVTS